MIELGDLRECVLARRSLVDAGLEQLHPGRLSFSVGSAFDVPAYGGKHTPLAVSVCNTIGVMQGPRGARKLFSAMGRYVRQRRHVRSPRTKLGSATAGWRKR
jgi:hypothetical protein